MLPRINLIKGRDADFLLSVNDTIISQHIYQHGVWEDHILNVSKLFLADIKHPWVIDIGANLGAFTIPIAKHIAPYGGVVSSFEPQRVVYYQLCGNIFLNRLDNCYAYQYALGEQDKLIDIVEVDFNQASNVGAYSLKAEYTALENIHLTKNKHPVQQIRLDNLPPPPPPYKQRHTLTHQD
ncbi:FkbM family methyltransferase [Moraxella oblonga]|uniref:FkbM family methyltransferase n=1 Tax=Moraxella oblonga TaxID=200413 RepID=UPI000831EBBE|nr:FkbM family methyltransferase [Moraxella oblonga]